MLDSTGSSTYVFDTHLCYLIPIYNDNNITIFDKT